MDEVLKHCIWKKKQTCCAKALSLDKEMFNELSQQFLLLTLAPEPTLCITIHQPLWLLIQMLFHKIFPPVCCLYSDLILNVFYSALSNMSWLHSMALPVLDCEFMFLYVLIWTPTFNGVPCLPCSLSIPGYSAIAFIRCVVVQSRWKFTHSWVLH